MNMKKTQLLSHLFQKKSAVTISPVLSNQPIAASDAPATLLENLNRWFGKHFILVGCILVLSWVGVCIFFYNSIVKSPLYSLYLYKESDNRFFDDWGKYLTEDWLNEKH